MSRIEIRFLNREQVSSLLPDVGECLSVVEQGLVAHGQGEVVLPPKSHLHMPESTRGHFNILPGYVGPLHSAGVKVVSDFVDNYKHDLPSEVALLTLYDPLTGTPRAIMDATEITWLRTGAVTGIGARHLAGKDAKVVAHIGARGTAFSNLRNLAHLFSLEEIRINSAREQTRRELAAKVENELGIIAYPVSTVAEACEDADVIVEATRLTAPEALLTTGMLKPGALLITYGWILAMERGLPFAMDKLVVDDWDQCCRGGQLFPLIESKDLRREHVFAEIGEICAGLRPGRELEDERILFWHRGFAVSDIALGMYLLEGAQQKGVGTLLELGEYFAE